VFQNIQDQLKFDVEVWHWIMFLVST